MRKRRAVGGCLAGVSPVGNERENGEWVSSYGRVADRGVTPVVLWGEVNGGAAMVVLGGVTGGSPAVEGAGQRRKGRWGEGEREVEGATVVGKEEEERGKGG